MSGMIDKELREGDNLLGLGKWGAAIMSYCRALEFGLRLSYTMIWESINPKLKKKIIESEEKVGRDRAIEKYELGKLINLFSQARILEELARIKKIKLEKCKFETLWKINEIRKLAAHPHYTNLTRQDAELVGSNVHDILSELGQTQKLWKQAKLETIKEKTEKQRIEMELRNIIKRIKLAFVDNPLIEIDEMIEYEFGKIYAMDAAAEVVGVCLHQNKITILAVPIRDFTHEDIVDEAYDKIVSKILDRVKEAITDYSDEKISELINVQLYDKFEELVKGSFCSYP